MKVSWIFKLGFSNLAGFQIIVADAAFNAESIGTNLKSQK